MTKVIHADATIVRTGPEWATIIRNDLSRAVEGIISAGQHLAEAKADVDHGEWEPMLRGIGISRSWAFKLMQIGEQFSNVSHGKHLPRSIKTLYELSQLDPEEVEAGMEDGTVHPDMTVQDARALAGKTEASSFEKAMKHLKAVDANAHKGLSFEELETLTHEIRVLMSKIGGPAWKL